MIFCRKVDGENLCEIPPLSDEDDDEGSEHHSVLGRLHLRHLFLIFRSFAVGIDRSYEEHDRHDFLDDAMGQDREDCDPDADRNGDMDDKRRRRSEPDLTRPPLGCHHKTGKHRLVGKLAKKNDGKDAQRDEQVQVNYLVLYKRNGVRQGLPDDMARSDGYSHTFSNQGYDETDGCKSS